MSNDHGRQERSRVLRGPLPQDNFVIVSRTPARDTRLSFKARGLLYWLMSHDAGFQFSLEFIAKAGQDGRDSVRSGLDELERYGYLQRVRQRDDGGRFGGTDYVVSDTPTMQAPKPEPEPEHTGFKLMQPKPKADSRPAGPPAKQLASDAFFDDQDVVDVSTLNARELADWALDQHRDRLNPARDSKGRQLVGFMAELHQRGFGREVIAEFVRHRALQLVRRSTPPKNLVTFADWVCELEAFTEWHALNKPKAHAARKGIEDVGYHEPIGVVYGEKKLSPEEDERRRIERLEYLRNDPYWGQFSKDEEGDNG